MKTGRLLGIDYGTKRVGLALSDDQGLMAFPHKVLLNTQNLIDEIVDIVTNERVAQIVIGHSKNREGSENPVHTETEALIADLTLRCAVPIHLEPEQYSTQEAIRFQGRTSETDAAAATVILNSYITKVK